MDPKVEQLHSQAESLAATFKQGGDTSCIDQAIELDHKALDLCPPSHPERSISLTLLAIHLSNRYSQFGVMKDLEDAIVLSREALDLRPQAHPDRAMSLNNLAVNLSARYDQLGAAQDLTEAIVCSQEALDLRPKVHPNRPTLLTNLALCLSTRYEQFGVVQDLDMAIVLGREALDLRPQGHPNRSGSLSDLGLYLSTRYKHLGAVQDLNEAIVFAQEALDLCPPGHPNRSTSMNNLALCLSTRYKQLGTVQDLNEAIVLDREALALRSKCHPNRSTSLDNLAVRLSTRYRQLGTVQDLNKAIVLGREALNLRPQGHPYRSASLNNLAVRLSTRYKHLGAVQDLNEAIVLDREALNLRPQGHPDRSMSLNNLAFDLSTRYKQLGVAQDLKEAIYLSREALDLLPQGHPNRSVPLSNLAVDLSTRHKLLGALQDLDEAIVLGREALDLCPQGHPDRLTLLNNLASYLCNRFWYSNQLEDKEEVFSLYAELAYVTQIVSSGDLSAARQWIHVAEYFRHPSLLLAYKTSLRLLIQHLATLPSLPQHLDILKDLTSSLAVDSFSACLRNRTPTNAVELLEQGRGVFWNQLTRLRSPLEDVVTTGPAGNMLAEDFTRLSSLIRNAINSPGDDQHELVYRLNLEMQSVIASIRSLPGLSRFLLPSLFSDLRGAAMGGPVIIINASRHSCDTLIILLDQDPVHIPLQITQENVRELSMELRTLTVRATKANVTRELAFFLRKLWDHIVSPIVDFLQITLLSQSRIWWCPTAEFSVLPLHAAGPYRKGHLNLPDLYISSYTPTLAALIRARRPSPLSFATEQKRFVAIGQAKATSETELLSVGPELDGIGKRVGDLAAFTRIDGEASCISRVVEELGKNEWVHFACHGLPNRTRPFESAFALHDGHFTIQRIIGCDLKNPEFAYLSACHTIVGDEASPDEVIHLASAMQFAGFRSVIGTMWAVDDGETNKITSMFYKHMVDESGRLDHTRAAFALNKTMKSVHIPLDQRILYVHLGA